MKYSILLMLNATPKWWVMNNEYRSNLFKQHLFTLFTSYEGHIHFRVFNADAFHAHVSDFFTLETSDLAQYYNFLKELRATKLFTNEYFILKDIVMGAENGFKEFNSKSIPKKEVVMN